MGEQEEGNQAHDKDQQLGQRFQRLQILDMEYPLFLAMLKSSLYPQRGQELYMMCLEQVCCIGLTFQRA